MVYVNDFKNGMTFKANGNIFIVLEATHSKSGRGQAHVKAKVKNLRTNAIINLTFTGGDKVESAYIDKRTMQYLYDDGMNLIFMDNDTYEQVEITKEKLHWELNFLTTSLAVQVLKYNEEILAISLPDKVTLKVIDAERAVKGDSSSAPAKRATTQTGFEVQVPLFINDGELIIVSTIDGKYCQRA